MRNHEEINVLKETQRNASRAVKTIDALMGKVYNQEFAYELTSERNRFQDFERKAEAGLWEHGLMPKESSLERICGEPSRQIRCLISARPMWQIW